MRAAVLLVLLLGLSCAAGPLWAGPFSELPTGHWAYQECSRLASLGWLSPDDVSGFSGGPELTRYEFAIAIVDPLIAVEEAANGLGPQRDDDAVLAAAARALRLSANSSEDEIASAAMSLRRLCDEFSDELRRLGLDPDASARGLRVLSDSDAVRAWRSDALQVPPGVPALADGNTAPAGMRVPFARGTVAVTLPDDRRVPGLLDYLALSAGSADRGAGQGSSPADPAAVSPRISRLRTAYEYGVGPALTLSLAYEEIARRGQGMAPLDSASLASVGIGYQLTPSTSVKLSYSLLEYGSYVYDTPPLRDRVAETAVSIEF